MPGVVLDHERYMRAADQARLARNAMVRTMAAGTKFDRSAVSPSYTANWSCATHASEEQAAGRNPAAWRR